VASLSGLRFATPRLPGSSSALPSVGFCPARESCMSRGPRAIGLRAAPVRSRFGVRDSASREAVPRTLQPGFILSSTDRFAPLLRRSLAGISRLTSSDPPCGVPTGTPQSGPPGALAICSASLRLATGFKPFGALAFMPLRSPFAVPPGRLLASLPARVPALFAASRKVSTLRAGAPAVAPFRPRVFATPRRFPPPSALRACFIPLPRPGFLAVQGFLPSRSRFGSSPPRAPLPLSCARSPPKRLPRALSSASRPCSTIRCVHG
jgi:hypothetical protein